MPFVNIQIVKEVLASDPAGTDATGHKDENVWIVFVIARDWYLGQRDVDSRRFKKR